MAFRGSQFAMLVSTALLCAALSACGWRTALSESVDGSVPTDAPVADLGTDMARVDMGRTDMGVDFGVDAPRCNSNFECDDGNACNGSESCSGGVCVSSPAPTCNDGVACTNDSCDPSTGACTNTPDNSLCPDGLCDPAVGCQSIPCGGSAECSNGLACDGEEQCVGSVCRGGAPPCGTSTACTTVACSESSGTPLCAVSQRDSDRDGFSPTMCGGDDCDDGNPRVNPGVAEMCTDGTDNNCNGAADCSDMECATLPACMMDACPSENLGSAIGEDVASGDTSGRGNSFSESCIGRDAGASDITFAWTAPSSDVFVFDTSGSSFDTVLALRTGCRGAELECDDDGGAGGGASSRVMHSFSAGETTLIVIDGFSSEASGEFHLSISSGATGMEAGHCHDGVDNDSNGFTDCADFACRSEPGCCMGPGCGCQPSENRCRDGRDEDCDGLTDCEDTVDCCGRTGCAMSPFCSFVDAGVDAGPDASVDAGVDAGDDGGIMDGGVPDAPMCLPRENTIATCTDGADNDCDTRVDCSDTDCRPLGAGSECCNGLDDDGDGTVDLFTCRCFADSDCVGVGDFEQVCWVTDFHVCAPRCDFLGGNSFCDSVLGGGFVCNTMTGECVAP